MRTERSEHQPTTARSIEKSIRGGDHHRSADIALMTSYVVTDRTSTRSAALSGLDRMRSIIAHASEASDA